MGDKREIGKKSSEKKKKVRRLDDDEWKSKTCTVKYQPLLTTTALKDIDSHEEMFTIKSDEWNINTYLIVKFAFGYV